MQVINLSSLCEGEKRCRCTTHTRMIGTTFGGASDIPDEALHYFKGKRVFIVGDYDTAGMKRVRDTYEKLKPIASVVKHCWLEGQGEECNDLSDWFAAGHSVRQLKTDSQKLSRKF